MLRTLSPKAESSGVIDCAIFDGRKRERERCKATSSYSWFRTWGGLWKKPLLELEGSATRWEGWEVAAGFGIGICRDLE